MKIDWNKPAAASAALAAAKKNELGDIFSSFDPTKPAHRASLVSLPDSVYERLAKHAEDLGKFARAAYFLVEEEATDAAIRIYDALLHAKDVSDVVASNTLYALATGWRGDAADVARAKRHIKRWSPVGKRYLPLCSNLALLLVHLGEHDEAIANLRRCVLLSDPTLDLDDPGYAPLRKLPDFKKLSKLQPTYPASLQTLAFHSKLNIPVTSDGLRRCAIELIDAEPEPLSKTGFPSGLTAKADAVFSVFGATQDGGLLAFWERKEGTPLEERPVVIFGSDGMFSVYAPHLLGFLTLLGHGCSAADMEGIGFRLKSKKARGVEREGEGLPLPSLARVAAFAAALAKRTPSIAKRKAVADRDAAIALIPEFAEAVLAFRA